MSIVSIPSRTRRYWLRWLFGFSWVFAIGLAASCARAAEIPSEPDDYVIVADEEGDSGSVSEPKRLPADDVAPMDEQSEEQDSEASTEDSDAEESPSADGESEDATEESEEVTEETSEENAATEEVAPIGKRAPDVPPPSDDAEESLEETEERDIVRPATPIRRSAKPKATEPKTTEPKTDEPKASEAEQSEPAEAEVAPGEPTGRPAVEGASFKGVQPATTTAEELETAWGPPKEVRKGEAGTECIYYMKPFKQVVVTVVDKTVDTILIHLDKQVEPAVLAKQLLLDDVEPATIFNSKGQMLGMAFPERGVLFGFAAGTPVRAGQIVLEPINSQPFVTRAEKNCRKRPTEALVDVEYAIEIDPQYDRAHAVHARVLHELGQYQESLKAAEKAVALNPEEREYQLLIVKAHFALEEYDRAEKLAEQLVSQDKCPPPVKAQAQKIWGDSLAAGSTHAFDKALEHHTEAIKIAEQVTKRSAGPVRRAAKELLVDAHLAVAQDIAWGNWQQKSRVVPKWIDRANAFCDNLINKDFGDESIRFRVYEHTLHAYAGMKDAPDCTETIDKLTQLGRKLMEEETNTGRRQTLAWKLGEAMASAMLIAQAQKHADAGIQYGQQALAFFEQSAKTGENWPNREQIIGKVYYRLGALQAVEHGEHKKAIAWYDKAVPLLESPASPTADADQGRVGEMFVSMGVSYWETGNQTEAVRLTQQGARMMESAVEDELLPQTALMVPYGNLSSMHAELGDSAQSKRFAEMASKADTTIRR